MFMVTPHAQRGFLLTPLREGRLMSPRKNWDTVPFLLTPLREGRRAAADAAVLPAAISTHAPAGGATPTTALIGPVIIVFLLTPLREGRQQFSTSPS